MRTVSVIGYGQIGSAVVQGIGDLEGWQLGNVLTRTAVPGLQGHTTDTDAFLSRPADLILETAGPGALAAHGPEALAAAPVWSVGAVAMTDPAFRARIARVSAASGHDLRLFACGMASIPTAARHLRITMRGPEIEAPWSGPLSQAATRWPDRLNTAVAAALNGPGLEATELVMQSGPSHEIEVEADDGGITWRRAVRFDQGSDAPHPVARMLLGELARLGRSWHGV